MGCGQDDYPRTNRGASTSTWFWDQAVVDNSRWLFVSNEPETVGPGLVTPAPQFPQNLYNAAIPIPESGVVNVRAFVWNGHSYADGTKYVLLVAELDHDGDEAGTIRFHKSIALVRRKGLLFEAGVCLAKAQRRGSLDSDDDYDLEVGTPTRIGWYELGPPIPVPGQRADDPQYACAIHEFTCAGPAGSTLRLRAVMSDSVSVLGDWSSGIISSISNPHVRGSWPYSAIRVASLEPIDVGLYEGPVGYEIAAAGGAEEALFQPRPGDAGATVNRGLYGVNVEYQIQLTNSSQNTYALDVCFTARPVGAKYFGAVDTFPNTGILPIGTTGQNVMNACIYIEDSAIGELIPNVILRNATAGACGTPVDFFLDWEITS